MTDKASLIALQERVDSATGPDRELDAAITVALTPTRRTDDDLIYLRLPTKYDKVAAGTYWLHQRSGMSLHTAAALTASVDAALALVERRFPGWTWDAGADDPDSLPAGEKPYYAAVTSPVESSVGVEPVYKSGYGAGATAPLAIVSAALAALVAEGA